MEDANQYILLLIDSATSHVIGDVNLTHIKVVILPPRTTSKLQPMDAGIIAAFKHQYCCFLLQHAIDHADLLASTTLENNDTDSINESNSSFITPSNPVRLDAIRTVISLLDTTISDHNTVLRTLHLLQQEIQLQVFSSKIQTTLDSFIQVEYQ
ncbi:9313_t:CDS:2 [Cetraspora pellucida]|uniref:9313_t:CDS:1 n=1 Tax=Cetraspora pellucida TaxID=1433469 RepID=A0A9N9FWN5_9GLOM|nr:9313_t:CDS:2 [Cetraspora pellucida]